MALFNNLSTRILFACVFAHAVFATSKMVSYWGQNSAANVYGNDESKWEKPLRDYCTGSYDIIVIGFAYIFPTAPGSQYPGLNFANHCNTTYNDANPLLLICPEIATDIQYCQSRGVQLLISMGGGVGLYGLSSAEEGIAFATTMWNMFLGGSGPVRPFGNAILDGIDLDIEGGPTTGYPAFVSKLRSYFSAQTARTYYISSAPQCFYPDRLGPGAGTTLQTSWFDYVFIQFYNNHCGLQNYFSTNPQTQFNWNVWAAWATTMSVNPNVKIFLGAPSSPDAAASGFVDLVTLRVIHTALAATYSKIYGGMMIWDASSSDTYNNFGSQVATMVHGFAAPSAPVTPVTVPAPAPVTTGKATTAKLTTAAAPVTNARPTTGASARVTTAAKVSTGAAIPVTNARPTTAAAASATTAKATVAVTSSRPASSTTKAASPIPTSSIASGACEVVGDQVCTGPSSYSTCSRGRTSNVWVANQDCQVGLFCRANPTNNYIYCDR